MQKNPSDQIFLFIKQNKAIDVISMTSESTTDQIGHEFERNKTIFLNREDNIQRDKKTLKTRNLRQTA